MKRTNILYFVFSIALLNSFSIKTMFQKKQLNTVPTWQTKLKQEYIQKIQVTIKKIDPEGNIFKKIVSDDVFRENIVDTILNDYQNKKAFYKDIFANYFKQNKKFPNSLCGKALQQLRTEYQKDFLTAQQKETQKINKFNQMVGELGKKTIEKIEKIFNKKLTIEQKTEVYKTLQEYKKPTIKPKVKTKEREKKKE